MSDCQLGLCADGTEQLLWRGVSLAVTSLARHSDTNVSHSFDLSHGRQTISPRVAGKNITSDASLHGMAWWCC